MDNSLEPLVSVYITTHNRSKKMLRAFYSVLLQNYKNIEIIISDDGSSDDTKEYSEKLVKKYNNIVYIRNEIPLGANVARNNAIKIARGEFITGLDDDDIFKRNRITTFLNNWDDKYAFICDNLINIYPNYKKDDFNQKKKRHIIKKRDMLLINQASNQIFTKLERIKAINGFNESLKKFQDWDCWLRLIFKYDIALRLNCKTYYMYHDEIERVSNNQKYHDAFIIHVSNNIEIYKKFFSTEYINSYLFEKGRVKMSDILKCKNRSEVLKVLRRVKIFRKFKNMYELIINCEI